ncbi:hypothetical protein Glove_81g77 [Diversispora epigaea]|uniref:SUN-like protein 1 n=1 Tax=Diversispora epigaea TaxID=1348612 RepID=A0A397JIQ6_9GLOM|nr:hypothetical protein Glove_81g77 [Diversispora epigaea]
MWWWQGVWYFMIIFISIFLSPTRTMNNLKINHGNECRASQTKLWQSVPTPSTSVTVTNHTIPKMTCVKDMTKKLRSSSGSDNSDDSSSICYSSSCNSNSGSLSTKNNKGKKDNKNIKNIKNNKDNKDNYYGIKSNDKLSFDERKTQDISSNSNSNSNSDAKSRQKKRPNTSSNNAIESLDGEDIGAVFENSDSPGLISEYEIPDISQLKERFNFASFDCGASVLKANKEAKGTSAILSESKDTYVLNQCSATKFVIVELCEDILIEYVAIANFEFFSSTLKDFRISISDWYPPKNGWTVLGQYKAKNLREIQVFKVLNPLMFARYLRIDFLSHYGHQHYCPVSLLRVHGTNEYEKWKKEQAEINTHHNVQQVNEGNGQVKEIEDVQQQYKSHIQNTHNNVAKKIVKPDDIPIIKEHLFENDNYINGYEQQQNTEINNVKKISIPTTSSSINDNSMMTRLSCPVKRIRYKIQYETCPMKCPFYEIPKNIYPFRSILSPEICLIDQCLIDPIEFQIIPTIKMTNTRKKRKSRKHSKNKKIKTKPIITNTPSTNQLPPSVSLPPQQIPNTQQQQPPSFIHTVPNGVRTQESIFKTIMKRLSLLESNSNLSKKYIEEQSKMLNDIILMIELSKQHQYLTITNQFNETLDKLKTNYESMLATSLINLNKNQIQLDEELKDLYSKVHILINEVIFAKWLGLISILLLTVYVVISQNWFNLKSSLRTLHYARIIESRFMKQKEKNIQNIHKFGFNESNKIPETVEQIRFPIFRSKHNLKNSRNLLIRPIRH